MRFAGLIISILLPIQIAFAKDGMRQDPIAAAGFSGSSCETGQTYCKLSDGETGCCPYYNGTCCRDGERCCPNGYECDESSGTCKIEHAAAVHRTTVEKPSSVQYVYCPDGSYCYDGETCCPYIYGGYSCCVYTFASCCANRLTCCPFGYICSGSYCYGDEKNFPFLKRHGKTIVQTMTPLKRGKGE